MPAPQSEVNNELFRRVNVLEQVCNETNGYLKGIVESNEKLIKLFSKALYILAAIAVLSLLAVIYGAIGKEGMKSVRETMPRVADIQGVADLDKWWREMATNAPFC